MSKKVRCDNCGEYLGTLQSGHADFETPSRGGIAYRGGLIGRIKYFCNDNCKKQWKNQDDSSSSNKESISGVIGNVFKEDEKSSEQIQAEAEASVQRAKINAEAEIRKDELEFEKKKFIAEKAKDLRAEGKNYQAFYIEHKKLVIYGGIALLIIIGNIIDHAGPSNNDIDTELAKKADNIEILISTGDKEGALVLLQQLYHESTLYKGSDSMHNTYSYKEYWDKKREVLKNNILKME